jgi:hypothetical protein
LAPFFAFSAEQCSLPEPVKKCPAQEQGATGSAPGAAVETSAGTTKDKEDEKALLGTDDLCVNEHIGLADAGCVTITATSRTNQISAGQCSACTARKDTESSQCATVTYPLASGSTLTISKCGKGSAVVDKIKKLTAESTDAKDFAKNIRSNEFLYGSDGILKAFGMNDNELSEMQKQNNPGAVEDLLLGLSKPDSIEGKAALVRAQSVFPMTRERLSALAQQARQISPTESKPFSDTAGVSFGKPSETVKNPDGTFKSPMQISSALKPNPKNLSGRETAEAAQTAYSRFAAAGYSDADIRNPNSERFGSARRTLIELFRDELNTRGALHPELDTALILAVERREQGLIGQIRTSSTGVRGEMQVTVGTADDVFDRSMFTLGSGQQVNASAFSRELGAGSILAGASVLNERLLKWAPVVDGAYDAKGVAIALQSYNGFGGVGGDKQFGAKAYADTQILRQAASAYSGSAAQSMLAGLYGDRSKTAEARSRLAAVLTSTPTVVDSLPYGSYNADAINFYAARSAVPGVSGVYSPLDSGARGVTNAIRAQFGLQPLEVPQSASGAQTQNPIQTLLRALFGGDEPEQSQQGSTQARGSSSGTPEPIDRQPPQGTSGQGSPTEARLIVFPHEISAGEQAIVSWSSVGVPPSRTCELYAYVNDEPRGSTEDPAGLMLAAGIEGSYTYHESGLGSGDTATFMLRCPTNEQAWLVREGQVIIR